MSDSIFDDAEFENDAVEPESELEPETVGQTSDEGSAETSEESSPEDVEETTREKPSFSLFDAMLLISLVCVTLATLLLVFELREIDANFPFGGFPWRTTDVNTLMFW